MSRTTLQLTEAVYQYYLANSLHEAAILEQLRADTKKMSTANMQIAPEEGQLLAFIVKLLSAKKTLDIGVFTGYSALVVAMAMSEDGKVIACDINSEWTKIAQKYWVKAGQEHKIELKLAPASETLQGLLAQGEQNSFDFAFIDADKKNYRNYYEYALSLLRSGGVIAVDNVLWSGDVADATKNDEDTIAIREFNKHVHQDTRIVLSMLPIADGLTLAMKR
jgi:predicted O-methyltransferase YrrM